jgi:hypothetical protein
MTKTHKPQFLPEFGFSVETVFKRARSVIVAV